MPDCSRWDLRHQMRLLQLESHPAQRTLGLTTRHSLNYSRAPPNAQDLPEVVTTTDHLPPGIPHTHSRAPSHSPAMSPHTLVTPQVVCTLTPVGPPHQLHTLCSWQTSPTREKATKASPSRSTHTTPACAEVACTLTPAGPLHHPTHPC
jgi:hypothetical protein